MVDGERLAELRNEKGLSQEDFGAIFSLSGDSISNYERNKTSPSDDIKIAFARFFNVSLDYLLGLTREQTPIHDTGSHLLLMENLPQGAKDELSAFLNYLKKRYSL